MELPCIGGQCAPRRHGLLKENHIARYGTPPYKLLVERPQRSLKQHRLSSLLLVKYHNYMVKLHC